MSVEKNYPNLCLMGSILIPQVLGNDYLYYGDSSYLHELASLAKLVLEHLVDSIQQEPSSVSMITLRQIRLLFHFFYFAGADYDSSFFN